MKTSKPKRTHRVNKAKINYIVDVVIGIGFLLAAVSGVVLLFAPSGGYRGGRNPGSAAETLLLTRHAWDDLHTWSSLIMIAGVLGHLVLHWNWIVCMTRNLLRRKPSGAKAATRNAAPQSEVCGTES